MRNTILYSLAAVAALVVWVLAARSMSMMIDRVHRLQLSAVPVTKLRFDNGTMEFAGVRLDTLTTETMPSGLKASLSARGRAALVYGGKVFPCGPGRSLFPPSGLLDIEFSPDPGDSVTYTTEQSHMSWPTPLAMNFMTGYAPSWERHLYSKLTWTKRSRARIEILWRYTQRFYVQDKWTPKKIEFGSAGLALVTISEVSDLNAAAVQYLTVTKHWDASTYRLENRGPVADGSGEIIAAIHRDDESSPRPGTGLSTQLFLDYTSRKVAREIAFQ